ncbi:hypothetical protein [Halorientalis halophila]|uniref:hypothetical protein n=1 Tax=Halorientalis halophila TaxID=3108499 RepID=UPI0030084437
MNVFQVRPCGLVGRPLELDPFLETSHGPETQRESGRESARASEVDLEEMRSLLVEVEEHSIWARFM